MEVNRFMETKEVINGVTLTANKNQMFGNMYQVALDWLAQRDPWEISRLSGIFFDGKAFHLESLGQAVTIDYPDYTFPQELNQWHFLSLLHYLSLANGRALSGQQITFANYKNGMIRGGGFDRETEKVIQTKLGKLSPDELKQRCLNCGAIFESSNADLCARFTFAPNYPVWLKIWFADEEFPASGRMLLDASAENYLSIEDAVTVGGVILDKLLDSISEI